MTGAVQTVHKGCRIIDKQWGHNNAAISAASFDVGKMHVQLITNY